VGVCRHPQPRWEAEDSLAELEQLARSAGASVAETILQERDRLDPRYLMGRGKAQELRQRCAGVDLVILDEELSGSQQRNLEQLLGRRVVDRSGLILDIFAQRAQTREGKLQVELAQLDYLLPRLAGAWTHLERLGGGIGTRGPGETQLESDRRRIRTGVGSGPVWPRSDAIWSRCVGTGLSSDARGERSPCRSWPWWATRTRGNPRS